MNWIYYRVVQTAKSEEERLKLDADLLEPLPNQSSSTAPQAEARIADEELAMFRKATAT